MMTDRQLIHLINYIRLEAQHYSQFAPTPEHDITQARRDLTKAFGFDHHRNGYPKTPEPHTAKPATIQARDYDEAQDTGLATSDPEAHRQAIADADYDAKNVAISDLLRQRHACNSTYPRKAVDIMRLWPELKAIMEPNGDAVDRSLIESLIGHWSGIPDYALQQMAETGNAVPGYSWLSVNRALAILAARARLKT